MTTASPTSVDATRALQLAGVAAVLLLMVFQLSLGTSPLILLFWLLSSAIAFAPIFLRGVNLFTLVPIGFYIQYEGLAVIFKTVLFQSLDSNLLSPVVSFGLTMLVMLAVSLASLCAMRLAPHRKLLPEITDLRLLRIIGILAAGIGLAGSLAAVAAHAGGGANIGIGVFFSFFVPYPLLGMICEATYTYNESGHRRLFSWPLGVMFAVNAMVGIFNNARGVIAIAVVTLVLLLIITRQFRLRYFIVLFLSVVVFETYVSPVFLEVRAYRSALSPRQLFERTAETAIRAATDPSYLLSLDKQESVGHRAEGTIVYDYYNNQSNVLNRFSWIGLLDEIYSVSRNHELLGLSVIPQMTSQLEPRFLFPDKPVARFLYSDWLSFHYGIEPAGAGGSINFGLPMEGMVTIGLAGVFLYPLAAVFALTWTASWISGWKTSGPFAVFFFVIVEGAMLETQSDGVLNFFIRTFPVNMVIIYGIYRLARVLNSRREAHADGRGAKA